MRVVAHFYRYHVAYEEEFDSLEEAVGFLRYGFEDGRLAQDRIEVFPMHIAGEPRVYKGDELFAMISADS